MFVGLGVRIDVLFTPERPRLRIAFEFVPQPGRLDSVEGRPVPPKGIDKEQEPLAAGTWNSG